jgi:hypothetical protein
MLLKRTEREIDVIVTRRGEHDDGKEIFFRVSHGND